MTLSNLTPANTALLVIDVIRSCADPAYEDPSRDIHYRRIRRILPRLSRFINAYRDLGGRVLFTTTVPWMEAHLPENINELYRNDEIARYWSQETDGRAEQFYKIPVEGSQVVVKNTYDAFASSDLIQAVEEMHQPHLLIAGIFGDGCVMASICGGFSRGYSLVILKDLIETTDDPERQELQRLLKVRSWPLMYGPTIESREALKYLSREK